MQNERDSMLQADCGHQVAMKSLVRSTSRAALPLGTLLLVLGVAAGSSARGADSFTYTYDALGRLQSVTYQSGTQVVYTYDPAGNRTQVTNTPGSGSTTTPPTPQQRRKAAIQAVLSILLEN